MASQVLIYALFALSLNMMLGYGGMVSLGHAAYLGVAGYTCILLTIAGYRSARSPRSLALHPVDRDAPACSACCRCARRASASS